MGEGEVLAGFFVTFELALLHKEGVRTIPTGCFDRVGVDRGTLGSQRCRKPLPGRVAAALPQMFGTKELKINCLADNEVCETVRGRNNQAGMFRSGAAIQDAPGSALQN